MLLANWAPIPLATDLHLFPALADARPAEVTVRRGDVLYLPCCWWHAVRGSAGRNLSVNYWYQLHEKKVDFNAMLGSLGIDKGVSRKAITSALTQKIADGSIG